MKAIIVNEDYLNERFEAFINAIKVDLLENDNDNFDRNQFIRTFNYRTHQLKRELVWGRKKEN